MVNGQTARVMEASQEQILKVMMEYIDNSPILILASLDVLTVGISFLTYCHVCSGGFRAKRETEYRMMLTGKKEKVTWR